MNLPYQTLSLVASPPKPHRSLPPASRSDGLRGKSKRCQQSKRDNENGASQTTVGAYVVTFLVAM
jgi:hypothetical protein